MCLPEKWICLWRRTKWRQPVRYRLCSVGWWAEGNIANDSMKWLEKELLLLYSDRSVPGDLVLETKEYYTWISSRRFRPHHTGKILKRGFISNVRPTVHTNPSRKQSFSKSSSNQRWTENILFSKTIMWFSDGVQLKQGSKMVFSCYVFKLP